MNVFPPPRPGTPGRGGRGGEGQIGSNTQDIVSIPTLSAPHPQPFSPEYRGEGSRNLYVVRTRFSNLLSRWTRTFSSSPPSPFPEDGEREFRIEAKRRLSTFSLGDTNAKDRSIKSIRCLMQRFQTSYDRAKVRILFPSPQSCILQLSLVISIIPVMKGQIPPIRRKRSHGLSERHSILRTYC